jgi:hypothetical protein
MLLLAIELRSSAPSHTTLGERSQASDEQSGPTLIQLHIGNVTAPCRYSFHQAAIFDSTVSVKMNGS